MTQDVNNRTIGVIGLGNMGSALASALLTRKCQVVVWNRTASKADPLIEQGATLAQDVAETARLSEAVIVCVTDQAAIEAVLQDDIGDALKGKSLIQLGVVTADEAKVNAEWAQSRGIGYLEGSIFGVPADILSGTGAIVCSGPAAGYAEHESILAVFGKSYHVSDTIGAAYQFDKICYPFGYGLMLGYLQGAAMAKAAGFSLDAYTGIVIERLNVFPDRLETFRGLIEKKDYSARMAKLETWAEAYAQSVELCASVGVDDTLPKAHMAMMTNAIDAGYRDEEILAVVKALPR